MKNKVRIGICIIMAVVLIAVALCACGASVNRKAAAEESLYVNTQQEDTKDSVWYVDAQTRGSAGNNYGYSSKSTAAYDSAEPEEAAENSAAASGKKSDYNAIADASSRKLIRDATLEIETEKYDDFTSELNKAILKSGGYVQSSSESGNTYNYTNSRFMQMTVRIPAENLDTFLNSVSTIATVTSKEISVKEITGQYISTQSRIKALEAEYDALLNILKKADKVEDLITLQDRLTSVNAELERNKTTLKTYDEQIAYSTVTMSIDEVQRVTTTTENRTFGQELRSRLSDNLYDISEGARSFALWFISSLPYILIFAVIAVVVLIIVRHILKGKKVNSEKVRKQFEESKETK